MTRKDINPLDVYKGRRSREGNEGSEYRDTKYGNEMVK